MSSDQNSVINGCFATLLAAPEFFLGVQMILCHRFDNSCAVLAAVVLILSTNSSRAQSGNHQVDYFTDYQEMNFADGPRVTRSFYNEMHELHFDGHPPKTHHAERHNQIHIERESRFKLEEFNIYPTFSYLGDQVGNYCEFELASKTELGRWEMENRTVLNVADLPDTIRLGPTNPGSGTPQTGRRASGFGDVLSGFFFSRNNHRGKPHLGVGPVITLPTATDGLLGSGQFTIGPGAHFSTEIGRLTTGFFIWQSWGTTSDPAKKRVNQLFGKPFLIYGLNHKWNLVYIPLGLSHSWKAASGDDWTIPIGGGIRRLFTIKDQKMGLQFQAFDYVARKPEDPEWELRATIEFLFD